ncbi:MAG: arginine--tRNA ligase [Clostridiales bacterium]|jgi:arginyl-tRNA synthetase|nr:arginine--tRNA ligase [Clostridiales bacterium]
MDFITQLAAALGAHCGMSEHELIETFTTPPDSKMGDFAFPCFKLAKSMKRPPPVIAQKLCAALETSGLPAFVERVESAGPYLNFFIRPARYASAVLDEIRQSGGRYGTANTGGGRNVCIDYSSINIAKPFHIGHLSSTVIGHALYRIFNHLGYHSVGINHLGDWGTQFGKLIVAYQKWGDEKAVNEGSVRVLLDLYVRYHEQAKTDAGLNDEARAWFKRIEDDDPEAIRLFNWFKELTLNDVGRVYDMLGITFDSYAGESFYNDKMDRVIEELKAKNLLKLDKGAYIVDLEEYNMPPCIVLRSDGATLYATRDLAAAIYRKETYDFAKSLYVVAYQQDLHFRQIFKVLELMGYEWARDCVHVSFGMVSVQDGTLSTRKGKVMFLEDVLNASVEKTIAIMQEKSAELENKKTAAKEVGVGALIWNTLYNSRIKDVVFSYDKALNFEGETGPYVQYTHARCCAVMRRAGAGDEIPAALDYEKLADEAAMRVVRALFAFPRAVRDAAEKYEPYIVSRAVMALCQAYNKFYYDCRIVGEEPALEKSRLALTAAVKTVLETGLYLLGLGAPARM